MKKNLFVLSVAAVLALTLALPGARVAFAEEYECTGTVGAITLDNVHVPDGATCTLNRTIVQGTVTVGTGATLRANRVQVNGNIQAEGAALVRVGRNSTVGGSIQLVQGGAAFLDRVSVTHDILLDENTGALTASRNAIGGNLQAFQNTGGVTISSNMIDGNLQCTGNEPAPTGGGNIVQGNKEDQCAEL